MPSDDTSAAPTVAQVFDSVAETYDQTGVAFFQPVAERLVGLLAPQPGETVLDIGCGRGAATLPLAAAVGPSGHVDAVDVSPAMVAATREAVEALGLDHVTVEVADAADLRGVLGAWPRYDVLTSSLVLFFLDQPADVLRRWVSLVAPGGRVGLSTFGDLDEPSRKIEEGFVPWLPPRLLDARTSGRQGPFASEAGMEELMRAAGLSAIQTVVEPTVIEFADVAAWQRFSMSTGQRAMWQSVPEAERPGLVERNAAILEATRENGGPCRLVWQMRYTLGRR